MTKKLEDTLGLPHDPAIGPSSLDDLRKALNEQNTKAEKEAEDLENASQELTPIAEQAIAQVAEREQRVEELIDLNGFDEGTDEVFNEAMAAFKSTFSIAGNVEGHAAGKIYEAAANFIKVALDAKNSKVKARLDAVDLALKKKRLDMMGEKKDETDPVDADSKFLDRNEILASITKELELRAPDGKKAK